MDVRLISAALALALAWRRSLGLCLGVMSHMVATRDKMTERVLSTSCGLFVNTWVCKSLPVWHSLST